MQGGREQTVTFDAPLRNAFHLDPAADADSDASGQTFADDPEAPAATEEAESKHPKPLKTKGALTYAQIRDVMKGAVTPAEPVVVRHVIQVSGPSPSHPLCLDLHVEIPMTLEGGAGQLPEYMRQLKAALDRELVPIDSAMASALTRFAEHKRRHTLLTAFAADPSGTVRAIVQAQGRELRLAATKDADAVEVMAAGDVYKDRWVQDAVLKYLSRKQQAAQAAHAAAQMQAVQLQQRMLLQQHQMMMYSAQAAAAAPGCGSAWEHAAPGAADAADGGGAAGCGAAGAADAADAAGGGAPSGGAASASAAVRAAALGPRRRRLFPSFSPDTLVLLMWAAVIERAS